MTTLGEVSVPATSSENIEFGGGASASMLEASRDALQAAHTNAAPKANFDYIDKLPSYFWGVCRTRSRCEKALSEVLSILKVPWYLPLTPRKDASRHVNYVPLFPGFLFFQLKRGRIKAEVAKANNPSLRLKPLVTERSEIVNGKAQYTKEEFYEIDSRELIKPSARILKESPLTARASSYAAGFIPVTDQIQLLRELAALSSQKEQEREKTLADEPRIQSGQKVSIMSGPFSDFIGTVAKDYSFPFAKVQIDLKTLGRMVQIEVPPDQLVSYKEAV